MLLAMASVACVDDADVDPPESAADARATAHDQGRPYPTVVDDFWLNEQIAAMNEPPPRRPKSISLGYAGDAPLSGGVMRDTYIEPPAAPAYAEPRGCACDLRYRSPSGP